MDFKSYFQQPYQGGESFIENVIIPVFGKERYDDGFEEDVIESNPELSSLAAATGISQVLRLGTINLPMNPTDIFDITVTNRVQMERNRVAIQMLVRRIMSSYSSAFMIFHYGDSEAWDWRFSYCSKMGSNKEVTESKRFTFLLGPNQSCRTAADNFKKLLSKHGQIEREDIIDTFSVEALSKEFFDKYKKHYEDIIEYITGKRMVKEGNKWVEKVTGEPCPEIMQEFCTFPNPEKAVRDYVKKLMGRMVFIQFLQKKGWMGCPAGDAWCDGDNLFLQHLYDNTTCKDTFVDDVLEPLFNDLNTKRNDDLVSNPLVGVNIKVPYLNGGLFERDDYDKTAFPLPGRFIKGILDFFAEYNFTIDENDPNDAQVGVDPEMLGRIFENLLEDNKDKGTYYTRKEIVQYMCRESLIAYLQTGETDEGTKDTIRQFVTTYDASLLTVEQKATIDEKLQNVKICDPAIGSGAFPMGMLRELFFCRSAIEGLEDKQAANIKKHIIQQNIYGVDIEKGAVDIARLRFWLTLIIDEETPHALPNLDFKIMQGNSLLEQYEGVNLSGIAKGQALGNASKKRIIKSETDRKGKKGLDNSLQMGLLFDKAAAIRNIQSNLSAYYSQDDHSKRRKMREDINTAVHEYIKEALPPDSPIIDEVDDLPLENDKFFLWHTWFSEVFEGENPGFDIVIGNPPYIKEDYNSKAFIGFKETSPYYMGKMDIWYGFACHGIDFLKQNGIIALIAQNNWTTSAGAKKMRNKIVQDALILQMLDFNEYMVFGESASIQTMIMLFQKNSIADNYQIDMRRLLKGANKANMIELLRKQQSQFCAYLTPIFIRANRRDLYFTFSNQDNLLDKIAKQLCRLTDKEATNGIHPHYDFVNKKIHTNHPEVEIGEGIFGLSNQEKDNLNLTREEEKLVKPYYTSEQVKRYCTIDKNCLWLIYTGSEYKNPLSMDSFPNLKKHLDKYDGIISSDNRPYGLHRARQESFFKGEKIAVLRKCVGKPSFSYSEFDCYLSATFYVLKTNRWNMKFLTGVLNSKLIAFWLRHKGKMQGENYQLDKEPLLNIPLPSTTCEQQPIISLVDRILTAKKADPQADTSALEAEIDRLVYKLYDLTEDEIKIIESSLQ